MSSHNAIFLNIGDTFGDWKIVSDRIVDGHRSCYICECKCGTKRKVSCYDLTSGKTKSCGHGPRIRRITHGKTNTQLYNVWMGMKNRCKNPKQIAYKDYGGRGISICEEWDKDFELFYNWSMANGYGKGLTLDRIDFNGNYEPSNCRWVTVKENANNTRRTKFVTAFGETKSLSSWMEDPRCNVDKATLNMRLKLGWTSEEAISKMKRKNSRQFYSKDSDQVARTMLIAQGGILLGLGTVAALLKEQVCKGEPLPLSRSVDDYQRNVSNIIQLIGEALDGEDVNIDEDDAGGSQTSS